MTEYFKEEYLIKAKAQRKKTLIIYFITLAVYLSISAVLLVVFMKLPYGSKNTSVIKAIEYPLSGIFAIFSVLYFGIKYKRENRFFRFCFNLSNGIKETSTACYLETDDSLEIKDGVDCKSLIFLEWNKYKKDYFERKVLVFYEKDFPKIEQQAQVKFVTQGNFLINYEIIEKEEE